MGKQQKKFRKKLDMYRTLTEDDRAYLIETLFLATSNPLFFNDPLFQNQYTVLANYQNWLIEELNRLKIKKISSKKWRMLKEVYVLQQEMANQLVDYVELNCVDPFEYVEQELEDSESDYANYVQLLNKKVKQYQKKKRGGKN
ncbi:MAG TPA: hypothetical protein IAB56_07080 [Candidatus Scybalousia intestinigallinarum]|nr:hypothetical protein [Candidatus Scybalousia intestinigallinarum]